jgi:hypothetical protein
MRVATARMRNLVGFARCHALRTSGARAHRRRVPYNTLGLPLGPLERACIEQDTVTAILFMRQPPRSRRSSNSSDTGIKSKPVLE